METEDDKEFFEHLYNKYFFKVIQNVLPILKSQDLAEQVAIDTFWLLSQKFAEISRRDEDKIKGWLYVVAKNKAWHVLEKKYAKKRVSEECVEFLDDFAAPATDEQVADLREAVGNKQHRGPAAHKLQHPFFALLLEVCVTHGRAAAEPGPQNAEGYVGGRVIGWWRF